MKIAEDNAAEQARSLQQHYHDFIKEYRRQYDLLTESEKRFINNSSNYLNPTQVEVFWIKEPLIQLVIVTHFTDLPDCEVTINGPWESYDFIPKAISVLSNSEKWNKQLVIANLPIHSSFDGTYGEYLAHRLRGIIRLSQQELFEPKNKKEWFGRPSGIHFPQNNWTELFQGVNISELSHIERVNQIMNDIKALERLENENTTASVSNTSIPKSEEDVSSIAHGTYFFPPILLKEKRKPTLHETLLGIDPNNQGNKFFNHKNFDPIRFGKINVLLSGDGFISVLTEKKSEAINVLNTIMGTATLMGLDMFAVREHELVTNEYDPESLRITSYSYRVNTLRTMQHDLDLDKIMGFDFKPRIVLKQHLLNILTNAADVFVNETNADQVRLLCNAFTHLQDSEYPQSFITSWSIIERWISELWNAKVLSKKGLSKDRKGKLVDSTTYLTTDHKLEILNLDGIIPDEQYNHINQLKSKRNKFIHDNGQIQQDDAERGYIFASSIVKIALSQLDERAPTKSMGG